MKPSDKYPSKKLRDAIDNVVSSFQKMAVTIDKVFTIGRKEGFSDMEIGNMVRKELLAANYDPRTIRRALPPSAKHIEMVRKSKDAVDILSADDHENIAALHSNDMIRSDNIYEVQNSKKFLESSDAAPVEIKALEQPIGAKAAATIISEDGSKEIQPKSSIMHRTSEDFKIKTLDDNERLQTQLEGFEIKQNEEEQQQEPIKITWNILREIDTYDEQCCKRLLKQVIPEYLRQSSLSYQIKGLEESKCEKTKEIAQLKFKFKVCCWLDCKSRGIHKTGYDKLAESDGWYCARHYKDNLAMSKKLDSLFLAAKGQIEPNQDNDVRSNG